MVSISGSAIVHAFSEAIEQFSAELVKDNVPCKKLFTSHAFHSAMMDPVVDKFIAEVARAEMKPPRIPFVSTVTTQWISDKDATDAAYWGRHLRMPVRFFHAYYAGRAAAQALQAQGAAAGE